MVSLTGVDTLVLAAAVLSGLFAFMCFQQISRVKIPAKKGAKDYSAISKFPEEMARLADIYDLITLGAKSFLHAEYKICGVFVVAFGLVIFFLVSVGSGSQAGLLTAVAFLLGALTSMAAGYLGMMIAVYANARTTIEATKEADDVLTKPFNCAFRAGAVMGFALCALGTSVLLVILLVYKDIFGDDWETMMDCVAGYGLGGSSIAMFGRVGGGIYTKAADVGADLVGKVVHGLEEDDPKNPATIADNVGDNVGDVAGMGADLFGSFAESTCAALVIGTSAGSTLQTAGGWGAVLFPVAISSVGIVVCALCHFIATDIYPCVKFSDVEKTLKIQLISTTFLMVPAAYFTATSLLPDEFTLESVNSGTISGTPVKCWLCVAGGCVAGLFIGLVTEYYTSFSYSPVRELADACKQGAAVNIIYGLALGYRSAIVPVFTLAAVIYAGFSLCDLYGVALTALGMLSTLATGLTIDGYGPVTDNAGGIAEMSELPPEIREKTDCLDAAGNTTAAIGKGFAIGSAALVSLALYGAFVIRLGGDYAADGVNCLAPLTFAFLLIGSMLPYWFSAMTMKSVGKAAAEMVREVERQFKARPELLEPNSDARPDYEACITISTNASLREMIAPSALVMLAPLVAGTFFGVEAVFGILTGGLVSGVQLAVSMSNSGGAWDNAKKWISSGLDPDPTMRKKGPDGQPTDVHTASVTGDTVGDPCKDTSGPALNILMKLSAILSLVFAEYFVSLNGGHGIFNIGA